MLHDPDVDSPTEPPAGPDVTEGRAIHRVGVTAIPAFREIEALALQARRARARRCFVEAGALENEAACLLEQFIRAQ